MSLDVAGDAPAFAFVAGALDRAEHLRDNTAVLAGLWPQARVLVLDADGLAFADDQRQLLACTGAELSAAGAVDAAQGASAIFLGIRETTQDGKQDGSQERQAWFALPAHATTLQPVQRVDLRSAAAHWPALEATAFAQARAVLHWRARHRHCGACGNPLEYLRAGWLGHCPQCGLEHYPRTDPAVIVSVTDGERLLLGRQAEWQPRRYSTLAGFVEPGESLEQTVIREVFEESRVRVRSCCYLASQPWPFPSSLMLGFSAQAEPDKPVFGDELEDARWFTFAQIDAAIRAEQSGDTDSADLLLSPPLSISRWLVDRWHRQMAARS